MAAAPPGPVRIFAYGSLAWSPCFDAVRRERAVLEGHRRAFSVWSVLARGTPRAPGLALALVPEAGAACEGILYTLAPGAPLLPLWEREMWTRAYRPVWAAAVAGSRRPRALAFAASGKGPQHAGDLPRARAARLIAAAAGRFGTCRDYLARTVSALRAEGIRDPELERLLAAVDRLRAPRRRLRR